MSLYRVFPYEPFASSGSEFAPDFVPLHQGSGRFDLRESSVWYLAESPEHAVAEVLQGFRGRRFAVPMLRRFERPLAISRIELPTNVAEGVVDLDDPAVLARLAISPGTLASDDRSRTQSVAERLFAGGAAGLRWWSKLSGDWHATVLFLERAAPRTLEIGPPVILDQRHPAVLAACKALAIPFERMR